MIDDLLIVEALALVGDGAGQARKDIGCIAAALGGDHAAEEVDHEAARLQAALELDTGDRQADLRHARRDQILEGAVHPLRLRSELGADEDARRHRQGELLDGGEHEKPPALAVPVGDAGGDHRVHALGVAAQGGAGERRVHDLAVDLVLVAVHQQQAVREDAAHDGHPRLARREDAILVEQDEAVRIGSEQMHHVEDADVLCRGDAVAIVDAAQAAVHVHALLGRRRHHLESRGQRHPRQPL